MPFIPHTEADVAAMLAAIGVPDLDALFAEVPASLRAPPLDLPTGMHEAEVSRLMRRRAHQDAGALCYIGAGAYDHHIPAAVWAVVSRGEFYSAYTPYQAEASQGTLQVLYEFQSLLTQLTAMEVANASLYDGASALAEAVLMAARLKNHSPARILLPRNLHPRYRQVLRSLVSAQGIELIEVDYDRAGGHLALATLAQAAGPWTALVISQPNFFGVLEEVDILTDWAHAQAALVIGVVNPVALGLLKPPGQWGQRGVDIACGDAQPLGIPLSSGGPYLGLLCSRRAFVRQLPGRLVGATVDTQGQRAYTLTLQAREQHIRRAKATSNICTNQGLLAIAVTLHLALLGPQGLRATAHACHTQLRDLTARLTALEGVTPIFNRPVFHEMALRLDAAAYDVLRTLAAHNLQAGFALNQDYPELGEGSLLVCATEQRVAEDNAWYAQRLEQALRSRRTAGCPVQPHL